MGLHMIPVRVIDNDTREVKGAWDWIRHTGDSEFYATLCKDAETLHVGDGWDVVRPRDFAGMHAWVDADNNVPAKYRPRLHGILDALQHDPGLWIEPI